MSYKRSKSVALTGGCGKLTKTDRIQVHELLVVAQLFLVKDISSVKVKGLPAMDGFYAAIGKRARRENELPENNDGNKRMNSGTGKERTLPGANSTVYRILCPVNVVGSVIGKAGKVIKSLRQQTRSNIKVTDTVPGVDERVIVIFSSPSTNHKERDGEDCNENEVEPVCPAQDALLRVHSLIVQQSSGTDNDVDRERQHIARLLAANSQIGGLIGKGGNNIQKLRSESGAQIQIRPKDELPGCAFTFGEVVVISGDATTVKKALYAVSAFLYKHPPKEQIPWSDILSATNPSSLVPSGVPALFTPPNYVQQGDSLFAHHSSGAPRVNGTYGSGHLPALGGYGSEAARSSWSLSYNPALPVVPKSGNFAIEKSPEEFCIRIVCPNDKIGGVIGKGGNIIKSMRKDTGASIKVEDAQSDSDERVIVVSSTELAIDGVSPTLEAVLQLQGKTSSDNDNDEGSICTRLLVPSKHIGCLLGKGGNIISDMRKHTGANIRIFRKEERPKFASQNEELVQVTGEPSVARDAVIQITKRLRENIFKEKFHGATNTHIVPLLSSLSVPIAIPLSSSSYGTRQYDLGLPR